MVIVCVLHSVVTRSMDYDNIGKVSGSVGLTSRNLKGGDLIYRFLISANIGIQKLSQFTSHVTFTFQIRPSIDPVSTRIWWRINRLYVASNTHIVIVRILLVQRSISQE